MKDSISRPNHPTAWYDESYSGTWFAIGHLTQAEFLEAAQEQDGNMTEESLNGYTLKHLWRTNCIDGEFDTDSRWSPEYPHPITQLV